MSPLTAKFIKNLLPNDPSPLNSFSPREREKKGPPRTASSWRQNWYGWEIGTRILPAASLGPQWFARPLMKYPE